MGQNHYHRETNRPQNPHGSGWSRRHNKIDKEQGRYLISRHRVPPNLWCIEDSFYDLSSYYDSHPGGKEFLEITRGQDVTELFNTHHFDQEKVRRVLEKYFISKSPIQPYQPIFSFAEDGFFRTMQRRSLKHFRDTKQAWNRSLLTDIVAYLVVLAFLASFIALCNTLDWKYAILSGVVLHICYGLGHAFMHHGSNQPLRYIQDLTLQSSYHWLVTHCISHHHFINTNIDIELSALEPFEYFIRTKRSNPTIIFLTMHILQFFVSLAEFVSKGLFILRGQERFRLEYSFPIVQYLILLVATSFDFFQCSQLFFLMQGTSSYLLTFFTFVVHRTTYAYSDGSKVAPLDDFGLYCVQTTQDYNVNVPYPLNLFFFEGFNDHVLHHMFPTIELSKYPQLHKLFRDTLHEFGYSHLYKNHSFLDLYKRHLRAIHRPGDEVRYEPLTK